MSKNLSFFSKILCTFIIVSYSIKANSSNRIIDQRFSSADSDIPTYIEFNEISQPDLTELKSIFEEYWKEGSSFGFQLIGTEKDNLGQIHYRYKQTLNEVPIEFAEIIVHTKNNKIISLNGNVLDKVPDNSSQGIDSDEALKVALNYIGAKVYKWELSEEESNISHNEGNGFSSFVPNAELVYVSTSTSIKSTELHLAYKFNIYAHEPLSRREIYIDASTSMVLFENSLIHNTNVKGTASTAYSGSQTINTDSTASNSFRLRQTVSGGGVNTYDLGGGTTYTSAVDFTDSDNNWNNVNSNLDEYATDAHWGAEQTYIYFDSLFGRNSINDNGFVLNSYVHYSTSYANAFWDGQRMTYGDGNFSISPLVSLDIAGHEIAHGLTTYSANLIYQSESGALNESFSDIFGTAIEFFGKSSSANWTMGEDIGSAFRSMSNPNTYRDPDTYGGTYWTTVVGCTPSQQNDQCGVHTNSGVQNFWFYLLVNGGSGTNDNSDSYNVTGIGIDTAAAIAYRNLTVYLTRSSNYADARFYSILSATDLYGSCSKEVEATTNAWHAVGVGPAYVPGVQSDFVSADTTQCKAPFSVNFENRSNNGVSYFWDFGDGDTSTEQNPIHDYLVSGQFDVKLITDGGNCGVDSITYSDFVDIDTLNSCIVKMLNGQNPTQVECDGILFDSGGSGADYQNNELSILTISPPGAASVTIDFKQFDVETGTNGNCNFDYLEVFDGPGINSPSLGIFCNGNNPGVITSTRGDITLKFTSDAALTKAGFEMEWNCNFPTAAPVSDFNYSTDTTCSGVVQFEDYSTNAPSSYLWDFGDGDSSTLANPVHTYATNGTYTVKLISGNSFGNDTISKSNIIIVNRPQQATVSNDTICPNTPANLTASGQGVMNWYAQQNGGSPIYTGSNFTTGNLTSDSVFWVEDFIKAPTASFGPTTTGIGTGAYYTGDQYLVFDVYEKVELISVRVYAGSAGTRVIELRDSNGVVLQSKSRYIPSGPLRVTLNFQLKQGQKYQLGVSSQAGGPDLYRNNGGVSFPYDLAGKVSIIESSASTNPTGYYYFFYNWIVKGVDCAGVRAEAKVIIDTTCTTTSLSNRQDEIEIVKLYPNPVNDKLNVELSDNLNEVSIEIFDLKGKAISANMNWNENQRIFDVSNLSNGVYFIRCQTNEKIIIKKFVKN